MPSKIKLRSFRRQDLYAPSTLLGPFRQGHFASKIGGGNVCDILAGEQGSPCGTVKQKPNTKLIHVCFIDETEVNIEGKCDDTQSDSEDFGRKKTLKRKQSNAASVSKVTQSLPSPSKKGKMENT